MRYCVGLTASPKSGWQHVVQGLEHYASGTTERKEDQPQSSRSSRSITLQKLLHSHFEDVLMCILPFQTFATDDLSTHELHVLLSGQLELLKL